MANMVNRPATLQDYLQDQLRYFDLETQVRQMAVRIIYALDSNGRLTTPLADLVDPSGGDAQLAAAETALSIVQRLDPPGVGARDLRECLLLQLRPGMHFYEELRTLISDHLHDIERNQWKNIQRRTGYSIETIDAALKELRRLNPKPGSDFSSAHAPTVTPDVFVERDESGKYVVRLEDGNLPQLYISPYYRKMLMRGDATPEAREYIKKKISSAQWLIDSIEQRRSTVRKVSQAIVDHQTAFLEKGPEFIEPLKMEQIADKVGVHLTTVSRAVDDKWIQTPRGIFPLKRFFGGGTKSADGEEVAWEVVRLKLQQIIDHEDKTKPYSDDELVEELAKHDVKVARRTVTKYRKEMNIPSSRQRRDWAQVAERDGEAQLAQQQLAQQNGSV
jgi:RNA polymerase sigma-54 factor